MPVPSQNEFLLPFLTILSDGQVHTRSQMLFNQAKEFTIIQQRVQNIEWQSILAGEPYYVV